jgi:phosphonate transport system substrate-binding protein
MSRLVWFAVLAAWGSAGVGPQDAKAPPQDQKEAKVEPLMLSFGVYQSDKATAMYRQFIPVIECLEGRLKAALNRPVDMQLKIYKTYDEAIDALVAGQADFVRFGPAPYVLAKEKNPGIELLAMENEKGEKRFKGYVVVAEKSDIKTLADLKGKRFAFGDVNSTIGRYLIQAELVKAGIRARDLKGFRYLDRHDKVAKAVEVGEFDAGSIKAETLKAAAPGALRSIKEFDNVTKPWVARKGMDAPVLAALKKCLLELDDKDVLKTLGVSGFFPCEDGDYKFVREGMEQALEFGR